MFVLGTPRQRPYLLIFHAFLSSLKDSLPSLYYFYSMHDFKRLATILLVLLISCQEKVTNTWKLDYMDFPGKNPSSLPVLSSSEGGLLLSYVSISKDTLAELYVSRLDGESWTAPQVVTQGTDWFVNWADFPAVVENEGNLLAHILKKSSPATFSYDIQLQALPKDARTWLTDIPLHQDSTLTEHGFVSAIAYSDSSFFITWLDGRATAGGGHSHESQAGSMSLRAAEVDFSGRVIWDDLLDARTCDCCQTTVAMTREGPIVLYRNRSDREMRDIAITRLVKGAWTEPQLIYADGWQIAGCPVNGPKVAAIDQTVLAAWFTDARQESSVKVAFSTNSGADFDKPQLISEKEALGRVDVVLLNEDEGLVSWMEMQDDSTYLMVQKVNRQRSFFPKQRVASMDPGRKSGFPQLELAGDRVYFAWTEVGAPESQIALASVPLGMISAE